jgi:hypothetical protein
VFLLSSEAVSVAGQSTEEDAPVRYLILDGNLFEHIATLSKVCEGLNSLGHRSYMGHASIESKKNAVKNGSEIPVADHHEY